MDLFTLGTTCLELAQQIAPFDTGNLAFNSISLETTPNGFIIVFDDNIAPYVEYLEEGTGNYGGAVGFISQDTVYAITKLVQDYYNGIASDEVINRDLLTEKSKDNSARKERLLDQVRKGGNDDS